MLKNLDVVQILRLGAIGLGFLLALMSYRLLSVEQRTKDARPEILAAIKTYMGFALALVLIATTGEVIAKFVPGAASAAHLQSTQADTSSGQFNFDDYISDLRNQFSHGEIPIVVKKGELTAPARSEQIHFDLPAGSCRLVIVAVPPKTNQMQFGWMRFTPDIKDHLTKTAEAPNYTIAEYCSDVLCAASADVAVDIQMTKGSGPFSVEVFDEGTSVPKKPCDPSSKPSR